MARIRVIHWNESEAGPLLQILQDAGHQTDYDRDASHTLRAVKQAPPEVIVIDLTRLPSHGLEMATAFRNARTTRAVPLVFSGGDALKVEAIRAKLPDAIYASSVDLASAIARALSSRPDHPVIPAPMMERYAGRSAAQKLGIRENSRVALLNAPRDYLRVLGTLPDGVAVDEDPATPGDVTLWFVDDPATYHQELPQRREWAARTKLWVLWPKKPARKDSRINENLIREGALALGLVDYKVCSVNTTWSGLLFATRKGIK